MGRLPALACLDQTRSAKGGLLRGCATAHEQRLSVVNRERPVSARSPKVIDCHDNYWYTPTSGPRNTCINYPHKPRLLHPAPGRELCDVHCALPRARHARQLVTFEAVPTASIHRARGPMFGDLARGRGEAAPAYGSDRLRRASPRRGAACLPVARSELAQPPSARQVPRPQAPGSVTAPAAPRLPRCRYSSLTRCTARALMPCKRSWLTST